MADLVSIEEEVGHESEDEDFAVLLFLAGRDVPLRFTTSSRRMLDHIERELGSPKTREAFRYVEFDAERRSWVAANRRSVAFVYAQLYGNSIWEAVERDGAVSLFDDISAWSLKARLVEAIQVIDLKGVPDDPRPAPIGFRIEQGAITSA